MINFFRITKKVKRSNLFYLQYSILLVASIVFPLFSQYNRIIPSQRCSFSLDTTQCFEPIPGRTYTVNKDVSSLSSIYRFCLPLDTITQAKPIRVIFMLDQSASMCFDFGGDCVGAGRNDPTDERIKAAKMFVDNLALNSPNSQVGVVRYDNTVNGKLNPQALLTPASVTAVKQSINQAACDPAAAALAKKKVTNPGNALDTALKLSDINYDAIKDSLPRHIIILTDGAWEDTKPAQVFAAYQAAYPGRPLPTIHGVFLSDTAWHISHGFPAAGATRCTGPTDYDPVDLQYLRYVTVQTGGMYISNATPASIASRFLEILGTIAFERNQILTNVTFTDIRTNFSQNATITYLNYHNDYIVSLPTMPLSYGDNAFMITQTARKDGLPILSRDTLRIIRTTDSSSLTNLNGFSSQCGVASDSLSITCVPRSTLMDITGSLDSVIAVTAKAAPADSLKFAPNTVIVRAFTEFPQNASNTLALYHLDGNINDALNLRNGTAGTPAPMFRDTAGAFAGAMISGSFTFNLSLNTSDFTLEAWINPYNQSQQVPIISGGTSPVTFGINAAGYLFFSALGTTVTSTSKLDRNVWQHVAVSRSNGSVNLYINGLVSATAASIGVQLSGSFTVGPLPGCTLDEMRISTVRRTISINNQTLLDIPTSTSMIWIIGGVPYRQASANIPPSAWHNPNGQTSFFMANSQSQYVVVNLLHTTPSLLWSKNGDPVFFRPPGIPITAIFYDATGDGHIDKINLRWTDSRTILKDPLPIVTSIFKSITLKFYDGSSVALHPISVTATGTQSVTITLSDNLGKLFETGGERIQIEFTTSIVQENSALTVTQTIDSAGPVISKAEYFPNSVRDDWINNPDTLAITFSEPIVTYTLDMATPSAVFYYYDSSNGRVDTAFSGLTADDLLVTDSMHALIIVHKRFLITPISDSMQLVGNSPGCIDLSSNTPSLTSHKEPIVWGNEQTWKPQAAPNPFKPGPPSQGGIAVPAVVRNLFIQANQPVPPYGLTFAIDPLIQSSGSVIIYDPLGNIVMEKTNLVRDPRTNKLFLVWDGRNHNGRYVGGGVYLAMVTLTDNENKTTTKKLKIGVKR